MFITKYTFRVTLKHLKGAETQLQLGITVCRDQLLQIVTIPPHPNNYFPLHPSHNKCGALNVN